MAKWNIDGRITDADARKVAERLFPHDAPQEWKYCPPNCRHCAECKEAWEHRVQEVWAALRILES